MYTRTFLYTDSFTHGRAEAEAEAEAGAEAETEAEAEGRGRGRGQRQRAEAEAKEERRAGRHVSKKLPGSFFLKSYIQTWGKISAPKQYLTANAKLDYPSKISLPE